MLGIAIHCIQHSQAMVECGVCELAHSFFQFFLQEVVEQEDDPLLKLKSQKLVSCRICKGDHWTTKCPYKDTLGPLQVVTVHVYSMYISSNICISL